ncbi:MAG: endonuclease/exonuclease/phosphatase family protein [Phycisphaerales bacterium]|nr:endonuclease/exonuclease/phosphatase family protein [Phycisphaerales bacterium]
MRPRVTALGFALLMTVLLTIGCTAPMPTIRIVTYNIHHGEGTDSVFDLERIALVISALNPDLVALQEVDRATRRSQGVDQAADIAKLTKMHVTYGKAMDYAGGAYGVAILSRWPIEHVSNHPLPFAGGREPRTALAAHVTTPGIGELVFVCTHLQHNSEDDRLAQAHELNALFAPPDVDSTIVLTGDFNAQIGSDPMNELLARWVDTSADSPAPTWPSDEPNVRIDYVLYRPGGSWRVLETRVIEEAIASDHRPLLVTLQWTGAPR